MTAVIPLNTDSRTNFVQMSTWMLSLSVDLKSGRLTRVEQLFEPRGRLSVELAEDQVVHGGMPDHARLGNHRGYIRRAAGRVRGPNGARDDVDAIDAVLKRNDRGIRGDKRRQHAVAARSRRA